MLRLMWLAFFVHIVFVIVAEYGAERLTVTGSVAGILQTTFEHFHDRAIQKTMRRVEQLEDRFSIETLISLRDAVARRGRTP